MSPHRSPLDRSRRAMLAALAASALLAGCATPTRTLTADAHTHLWTGRLGVLVAAEPPQSFSASFELTGNAAQGQLVLTSPLGSTVATLDWTPRSAMLRTGNQAREYDSLEALAAHVTGTDIPVRALFDWLEGTPVAADGWQADLSRLPEGRLLARRQAPQPGAELRLVLDR